MLKKISQLSFSLIKCHFFARIYKLNQNSIEPVHRFESIGAKDCLKLGNSF